MRGNALLMLMHEKQGVLQSPSDAALQIFYSFVCVKSNMMFASLSKSGCRLQVVHNNGPCGFAQGCR